MFNNQTMSGPLDIGSPERVNSDRVNFESQKKTRRDTKFWADHLRFIIEEYITRLRLHLKTERDIDDLFGACSRELRELGKMTASGAIDELLKNKCVSLLTGVIEAHRIFKSKYHLANTNVAKEYLVGEFKANF